MPIFSNFSCLLLMGVLGLWLGFPNTVYHLPPLALFYPLSLFLIGGLATNKTEALRKGWIVGLFGSSLALYWLAIPIYNVGKLPWILAIPCALGIGAYVGLYGGIFSLASFLLRQKIPHNIFARCIALACIWYGLEFIREFALSGFSWLQISTAFVPWSFMIQGVSILGSAGLSAIYVCAILLIIESIATTKIKPFYALCGCLIFVFIILFGYITLKNNPIASFNPKNDIRFIMVEGNIDQNIKWEPASQEASINIYKELTRKALNELAEINKEKVIIIWPETAMPFYLERHPRFSPMLARFMREIKQPLVVGAPAVESNIQGKREVFNRAYLLNPKGQIETFYDKEHLVPFGEYVPSWLLINILEPLLQGIGNFTPGKQNKPLRYNDLALGMLICYESIFPNIARKRVQDGANILLNISNDGWFGDSSAPEQHLQLGIVRAVEQGRYLVRSTNTGISAIVDEYGRFILKGDQFKAQSLTGFAKIKTDYSIFFHMAPWLPLIFIGIFSFCLIIGRRKIAN